MSEPCETGGLPLEQSTKQLQRLQANNTPLQPTSTSLQQYKILPPSNTKPKGLKVVGPRRCTRTTQHAVPGPHIGSSRSEQPSTSSSTSMASQMSSVHYTRTGRISKAKKGLKVHNCENCGRSYTRAEHLRRHQKNHAQDDALSCEFAGCDKVFYRMDLLLRHQERHNDHGHDSRHQSQEASPQPESIPISMPDLEQVTISATAIPPTPSYYAPVSPMNESATLSSHSKGHRSQFARHSGAVSMPVDAMTPALWHEPYSPTPGYSSSSGYASPIAPTDFPLYSHAPYHRTRTPSNASFIDQPWSYQSRSPASTTSTMAFPWPQSDKASTASGLAYMNVSYPMTSMSIPTGIDPMVGYGHFGPKTMGQRDEEEEVILFGEYGMASIAHTYPFEQYLDYYWRLFHPTFPVVHRSTFMNPSPMLHAAMISIGGHYSNDKGAKRKSRDLHDQCIKLLERRYHEAMTEPERLCDFQAIFLIEVFSQYRARRSGRVLSSRFDKVYHKAVGNCRSTTLRLRELVSTSTQLEHTASDHWIHWVELATWQRLLLSCYILESQQPLLLARETLHSLIENTHFDIPFPEHTSLWDATGSAEWAAAILEQSYTPTYVYEITLESTLTSLDTFQSSVLLATHYNLHGNTSPYISSSTVTDIEHLLDTSPIIKRTLLTAKLVQVTPLRALLAVWGESWILSEKVTSPQAFNAMKITLRTWLAGLWSSNESEVSPVREAVNLSVTILRQALQDQRDMVELEMGTDMGIFFSGLVLWAITVSSTSRSNAFSTAVPSTQAVDRMPTSTGVGDLSLGLAQSQPQSPIIEATPENPLLSHAQIIINTISFLSDAMYAFSDVVPIQQSQGEQVRHQTGCVSLLLWIKLRLRGIPLEQPSSDVDTWASKPGESLGELLDGIISSIERALDRGWSGWGI
ncbi:Zn-finger protein [Pyrenophora teres f. maculata]|nr:Zn-finger protein [Pyrenophora teres f. maculata]